MRILILGSGLCGLSTAYLLQDNPQIEEIYLIEKETEIGGLCRSYSSHDVIYDIGPHIFFSKNKEILQYLLDLLEDNAEQRKRSNRILHKKCFVQYPFENDLSALPEEDKTYCVNAFMHNPYENYQPQNMLQFFLSTFGEGITNLYLRPYNEKIWKFDPSFMDTQMVERIPKPPREDILRSAEGVTVDGYLHQLYFSYPKHGGTAAIIDALYRKLNAKVQVRLEEEVLSVSKADGKFYVSTSKNNYAADKVISTIPANLLVERYNNGSVPTEVMLSAQQLRHNSIVIAIVNIAGDVAGDNFAFMVADKNVIFHRLSKIDSLGKAYHLPGTTTFMAEITYRKNDIIDLSSDGDILHQTIEGLKKIGFLEDESQVNFTDIRRFEYAYVVYDLHHRKNMDRILSYFKKENLDLLGRFGSFEYLNMDAVVAQCMEYCKQLDLDS